MDTSNVTVVADDDDDARTLVVNLLHQLGLRVFEASDGAQLIERVAELGRNNENITLVISDIGMPECDGIAATHALLRSHPDLPIVLMTAFADQATLKRAKAAGARYILRKPFSLSTLEALVIKLAALTGSH